jgi:multiple sugar transport system substrate-binding protein
MTTITRRGAIGLGIGAAAILRHRDAWAQQQAPLPPVPTQPTPDLRAPIESGATLRIIRPARFVEPDEVIFRENAQRFTQRFNVPVRVDFVGWEDIRPQTAVTANTGTGPDVVIGWQEDPHIYVDKLIELTDVADYLGRKYGGWLFLGEKFGKREKTNNWIGIPMGGATGPTTYRISAVKEAGFDRIPEDMPGFLRLCQALKKNNRPIGFALGNAVGDGNGFANFMTWSHGGSLVDEEGKVSINSPQTLAALNYVKELYQTFVPGTLSWLDPSNNRAFAAQEIFLTSNGVSLYYALKNDPNTRPIAEDTNHAPLPKGVLSAPPQSATILNAMVFRHTRFPNASKQFITFMMEQEQYSPWLNNCLGYWSHPLAAYDAVPVWTSDPKLVLFKDGMRHQFWSGYRGPISAAIGTAASEYIMVQMFATVASGQATPEAALRECERRARRIFR